YDRTTNSRRGVIQQDFARSAALRGPVARRATGNVFYFFPQIPDFSCSPPSPFFALTKPAQNRPRRSVTLPNSGRAVRRAPTKPAHLRIGFGPVSFTSSDHVRLVLPIRAARRHEAPPDPGAARVARLPQHVYPRARAPRRPERRRPGQHVHPHACAA